MTLLSGKMIYKASKVAKDNKYFRLANLLTGTGSTIEMSSEKILREGVQIINDQSRPERSEQYVFLPVYKLLSGNFEDVKHYHWAR